jgi:lipid II:glycine glycyltransferase (peptidoglycan interpeptide bridge formation enzyme)
LYVVTTADGDVSGGILGISSARGFSGWYGVVRGDDKAAFASYLLYWSIIEDLARTGIRAFDLGRSAPESGSYGFKKKWPGIDTIAGHAFFAQAGVDLSAEASAYERVTLKQRVWRRLPLGVANALGPLLRRQLPFG